ncbi:hypothetical protein B4589_008350 [Halolamina sp. CBA1230]|uniref:DUF7504 family protein n=1 Tax=Halolamina sp. CBA1230 TaxID=1853690 RepID=UPI001593C4A1|nr:hypothetical protein [Halolamina sp. CBA1230]QKY20388.1 hypothetical protein B4589_008350 [Halolamina sp. CBA1230]
MTATQTDETLSERLTGANSTLLLTSSFTDEEHCAELLNPDAAAETNVLWVSYTKSPDKQLRRWREHTDERPAEMGMVSVEDSTRSVAAETGGNGGPGGPSLPETNAPVETVNSPNDLTGLGIRMTEFLTDWEGNDNRTVVCFDSLTALLQYVELETAYEFLHIVTGRMAKTDAFAHFHMDPEAHDDQTVAIVTSLMDAVVEVDANGERSIRTRKS